MQSATLPKGTPGRFLRVAQALFSRTKDLALQAAKGLPLASRDMAKLLLSLTDQGSESAVDLICVHAALSLGDDRWAIRLAVECHMLAS